MVGKRTCLVDNLFNVDAISANVSKTARLANDFHSFHDVAAESASHDAVADTIVSVPNSGPSIVEIALYFFGGV